MRFFRSSKGPTPDQTPYWEQRAQLQYYKKARRLALKYCKNGKTLLDVGGGVLMGCHYLEDYVGFERTSIELLEEHLPVSPPPPDIRVICEDFLTWVPDKQYDLVLCLQTLEHIPHAEAFAQKLFVCGKTVVISVPYRWPTGKEPSHVHDPVDEEKLLSWTHRIPAEEFIVDNRIVAVYCEGSQPVI